MTAMLTTLVVLSLLVVLACVALVIVTVGPFVVGVEMAERRRFSTDRWGAVCLFGIGLALALAYVVHSKHLSAVLYLPAVALAWVGPGLLALLAPGQSVAGVQGAHER